MVCAVDSSEQATATAATVTGIQYCMKSRKALVQTKGH
jgi:hypothetical protein